MTAYSEGNRGSDVVKRRFDRLHCVEAGTLASGQNLLCGAVLGAVLTAGATETHAGNTGNGAMTLDATTPVLAGSKPGVYTVKFVIAATNGGVYNVIDPDGVSLGMGVVGGTFANRIKFVIADGATDFVVGDTFLVTVAAGSGKLKALAPTANDGTQIAVGVLGADTDASSADKIITYLARGPAVVSDAGLVWPGGITNGQKTTALAQLLALGIVSRSGI